MIGRDRVTWQEFSKAFVARFGAIQTDMFFDRFNKLQQDTIVEQYFDDFEKCRGQLLRKIPTLTSEDFLENFIEGLKGEIMGMIRLSEPTSVELALRLARYYETTLATTTKKSTNFGEVSKATYTSFSSSKGSTGLVTTNSTNNVFMLVPSKSTEVTSFKPKPSLFPKVRRRG